MMGGSLMGPVIDGAAVYIPTYKRSEAQQTLKSIDGGFRPYLVVRRSEAQEYQRYEGEASLVILDSVDGIGQTRDAIARHALSIGAAKFIMLDDDLKLFKRDGGEGKLARCNKGDALNMVSRMASLLERVDVVGVSARQDNFQNKKDIAFNCRVNTLWGVKTAKAVKFPSRLTVMEDFDMVLRVLKDGGVSAKIYDFAYGQTTNAAGGCSEFRTRQVHDEAAKMLARLHPGLVRLRHHKGKVGGEIAERLEVTISWKKAAKGARGG